MDTEAKLRQLETELKAVTEKIVIAATRLYDCEGHDAAALLQLKDLLNQCEKLNQQHSDLCGA